MMDKMKFWGAGTVGTKGQVVIPAEAREALNIKEGDKLLMVSAAHGKALMIIKPEIVEEYMERMQTGLQELLEKVDSPTNN